MNTPHSPSGGSPAASHVSAIDHYTIRCIPGDLPALLQFYTGTLGLEAGERPVMPFPGYWLYTRGQAVVHLFANLTERVQGATGALDHISFRSHDLPGMQARLRALKQPFEEMALPDAQVHQIFLRDPFGLKVELTFYLGQEASA